MKSCLKVLMVGAMVVLLAGCSSYYTVTDPMSEKVYYTKKVDNKDGGAVVFLDALTGREVTLQNSEVMEIEEAEFRVKTVGLKRNKK